MPHYAAEKRAGQSAELAPVSTPSSARILLDHVGCVDHQRQRSPYVQPSARINPLEMRPEGRLDARVYFIDERVSERFQIERLPSLVCAENRAFVAEETPLVEE